MPLIQELKYEPEIKDFGGINAESVKNMLKSIRNDLRSSNLIAESVDLEGVLKIVEGGKFVAGDAIKTRIDFSDPLRIINTYRKYSTRGCIYCINLGKETIDAQDGSSGLYCRVSDPDYDSINGVRYEGFSTKVKKHYNSPCEVWVPRFSQPLDELLKD